MLMKTWAGECQRDVRLVTSVSGCEAGPCMHAALEKS